MARASSIQACVFVNTPSSKALVFDTYGNPVDIRPEELTESEAGAYMAMNDAFNLAVGKHGSFQYENWVCPWDYGQNNSTMAQYGLFTFPTAIITARYPDGSGKMFVLGDKFIDKLTGGIWTAEKIYPYIRVLLLNIKPKEGEESLLCKIFPPLCSIGGWVWLGLAAGTSLKALSSKEVTPRVAWGGLAAFLWYEWYQRGGVEQVKEMLKKQ